MRESTTKPETTRQFTSCASLAALGVKLTQLDVFGPLRQLVHIAQKTVKHTPVDKLIDAVISLLAGAHGLVEINTRLRSDAALQQAFGRQACAEQSVVQETLNACTAENVKEMEQALDLIYRRHSRGYRHDYRRDWQVLDVDMSGMPCGPKAAFATKGYFAKQRNRRGRQLGRVLASRYDEVVVDRLFTGTTQLTRALQPLVEAAEQTLQLDERQRVRTLVRIDAGGGSLDDVNWLLARGYQFHGKEYSGKRAQHLAQSVSVWWDDPRMPGRQLGWVREQVGEYVRPLHRIAVRCRQQNGKWAVGVLLSTLDPVEMLAETKLTPGPDADPATVLAAYAAFYDQRGGGVETSFKGDKQGLGMTGRSKKRFAAQQTVMLLGSLAHNLVVWSRQWLSESPTPSSPVRQYGMLRMVRDVFHVSGFLVTNALGQIVQIVLNQAAPLASTLAVSLRELLAPAHIAINLAKI